MRQPGSRIAAALPEHVAVTASFFDDKDRATGAVVDGDMLLGRRIFKGWSAFVAFGQSVYKTA